MNAHPFDNFGALYRAAFAESNPERKQLLLANVKTALESWAKANGEDNETFQLPTKGPVGVDRASIEHVA
jgi:hypothetical protein